MTQRIFDIENEKDYADLWDIVPENIVKIRKAYKSEEGYFINFYDTEYIEGFYETAFLLIDWHDKTEITRPIQEATEQDLGKLCKFWDYEEFFYFGILNKIEVDGKEKLYRYRGGSFSHCRRLTNKDISELC